MSEPMDDAAVFPPVAEIWDILGADGRGVKAGTGAASGQDT